MNENQNVPFHSNGMVPPKAAPRRNSAGQGFVGLDEQLRDLIATNNGDLNKISNVSGAGGPPPAKPFPAQAPLITTDNQGLAKTV